jgi:DNA-binding transcriptional ArsR family regulator
MSARDRRSLATARRVHAPVFAALGDETRLSLMAKLCQSSPQSIARLTDGSNLTRQAISKHLRVLQGAGIVASVRVGRESQYAFKPKPIDDIRSYLDDVSKEWDDALVRLKSFVER